MVRIVLIACFACAGCIQAPAEIACGDLICPPTDVCLPDNTCTTADSADACAGVVDGTACQTQVFEGTCRGGACRAPSCGNGFVEGSEQCDGPVDVDCVDFGFDLGIPACTGCVLDLTNTCVRFGWRQVLTTDASAVWTDGSRFGVITRAQDAFKIYDATNHLIASYKGTFYQVTGNSHRIVAWSPDAMTQWDGTAFSQVDLGALAGLVERAALDEADVMYLNTVTANCTVYTKSPTGSYMQVLATPATDTCDVIFARGDTVLLSTHTGGNGMGRIYQWNGTAFAQQFTTTTSAYALDIHDGVIYAGTMSNMIRYDGTQKQYAITSAEIVALDNGMYNGGDGGFNITRFESTQYEVLEPPIVGHIVGDGEDMYIYGSGVYVYSGTQYAFRQLASQYELTMNQFNDGTIAMTDSLGDALSEQPGNYGSWQYAQVVGGAVLDSIAGASISDYYATDGVKLYHGVGFNSGTLSQSAWNIGSGKVRALWVPPSNTPTLYAVGDQQLAMSRASNGTWTPIAAPSGAAGCDLLAVTGNATTVIAAATCGTSGAVWELGGGTWTEIYRGTNPIASVALDATGNIFAAGPNGGARNVGGAWSDDPGAIGVSISGTGPDDVWVAGGPGEVINWDGKTWSRLDVVGASNPRIVVTPRAVYTSGTSNPVLLR